MSVKVIDKTTQVKANVANGVPIAIRLMLEDIHKNSVLKTPMAKTHNLRNQVRKPMVSNNKGFIEWMVHYADVQEKGYRYDPRTGRKIVFRNYTTPGTAAHFAENAVKMTMKDFRKFLKYGGLI